MGDFVTWMRATGVSEWVRSDPMTWPIMEMLHFIGMSLLLGVIGTLDFRLLGFMKGIPMAALRKLMPWGIAGFVINMVTGVLFFVGAPDQYLKNPAFYVKILFLLIAGLNALIFETRWGSRVLELGPLDRTPTAFKVAGVVSIFSWFMVLYWGRMLPFIGNAF